MTEDTPPKFLLCDQQGETDADSMFVFHTQSPRFVMEFVPGGEGVLVLIDPPTDGLAAIKDLAREFFYEDTVPVPPAKT